METDNQKTKGAEQTTPRVAHQDVGQRIVLWLCRLITRVPHSVRVGVIARLYRMFLLVSPRYRTIAYRNLALVFPERSEQDRRQILRASAEPFARMISDVFRLSELTDDWIRDHIVVDRGEELRALTKDRVVLYLGGHIGSFDLMVAAFGVLIQPMDFIVRENKSAAIEEWSYQLRTRFGNGVISRSGGLRRVLSQLKRGRSVGFLFDQNVTRNNAQFVSWFGRLAATTVAPGLVAERIRCPVIVVSIHYEGDDQYKIHWKELGGEEIYDPSFTTEDVRAAVLQAAVGALEQVIKNQPQDWFWLHRRWKTTPEGVPEDFYSR